MSVAILNGRHFVASSNNVCKFTVLGEDGLDGAWTNKPTQDDMRECNSWIASILNAEITAFDAGKRSEGAFEKGVAAYKEWKDASDKSRR